jgi:hypothetical protein
MSYCKQACLQPNYCRSSWDPMATMHTSICQDCGNMTIDQSCSHSLWTTLASTTKANNMPIISFAALKQDYKAVTTDWDGMLFCGITLDWDYQARSVDLSMPSYVVKALREFQHTEPTKAEHQPHRNNELQYRVKLQLTDPIDTTAPLTASQTHCYRRSQASFYTMHVLLIQPCWSLSAHLHHSKPRALNKQWTMPSNV